MDNQYYIPLEKLWDLVDKWRDLADDRVIHMPFLSDYPRAAHAQGLYKAANELSDLILDWTE